MSYPHGLLLTMESVGTTAQEQGEFDVWVRYVKKGQDIASLAGSEYELGGDPN